jgi:Uri superfamily endonuclease
MHFYPQYIESESAVSDAYDKENTDSNPMKHTKKGSKRYHSKPRLSKFHSQYLEEPSQEEANDKGKEKEESNLAEELKSEIKYMQVTHQKTLENLQRVYSRTLHKISDDYNKLENNLKDLCLQNIVMERDDCEVDLAKIVKMKYDTHIANNVESLTEQMKNYGRRDKEKETSLGRLTKDSTKLRCTFGMD